ncbi:Tetratricopeptide repeat protein [Pseudobythopirellula maris]|uniref:Tetratricopeptide repeat protein n=1 Tax=Pseudobythopirellula maris TaxID=2527991 RepID=A0A5C5ZUB0_9BACT|nr:tetratricopeptide repeat protein [Pseudobythopirellula maris]TWT91112.1 Tetratricopeptide repeat protein [Pseudobythopirellula maris]
MNATIAPQRSAHRSLEETQLRMAVQAAEGYLELGLTEHALRELERREALTLGDGRASYLWGECLRQLDRHAEAVGVLRRTAMLLPQDTHVMLALAWCYKRVGRLDRAIQSLERAVRFAPREAVLHFNLACYWSLSMERDRSLTELRRAIALDASFRSLTEVEPDFDLLRDDPAFVRLTESPL